ncbi:MAG: alpha-ketoacid dehydrogenase subunit beta [Gammaproteobacteria bacterium]|nr:alpha-ketoacid dehydrogenase subunit beta [Gammaproteobacteria bacterium]
MTVKTTTAAVAEAIDQEMARDAKVFLAGEDVRIGGPFGTDANLFAKYGDKRVINTAISEQALAGLGVGAAAVGLRPIIEIMIMDFMAVAMDQVVNQMAKMKYMLGGKPTLAIVVTTHAGIDSSSAAQHSGSLEAWFCHVPGLKVVMPSNAYDAKGLLISSIRDDSPVIFIHNKRVLQTSAEVPDEPYTIPLGVAEVKRSGDDITLVATGRMVDEALAAADQLAGEGVSAEVIDPRTLSPLDMGTILDSVRKTTRAVVIHEAVKFCGLGAEIAATISDEAFDYLDAPVKRVGAPFTPIPFAPVLEKLYLPTKDTILEAVREIM